MVITVASGNSCTVAEYEEFRVPHLISISHLMREPQKKPRKASSTAGARAALQRRFVLRMLNQV